MKPRGPFKNGRQRPAVFLGDMMDLFYGDEADEQAAKAAGVPFAPIPFEMLDPVFAVMALRTDIDILVLTKRPGRMREYLESRTHRRADGSTDWFDNIIHEAERLAPDHELHPLDEMVPWPLPNVWGGTSVESQPVADQRISELLAAPLAVRFLSCEPLLGPLDLLRVDSAAFGGTSGHKIDVIRKGCWTEHYGFINHSNMHDTYGELHWVIVGGESGRNARPCDLAWIRGMLEQCREAKVPCFVKQLGAWPRVGLEPTESGGTRETFLKLSDPKGGDMAEWPNDLRVREMPGSGE